MEAHRAGRRGKPVQRARWWLAAGAAGLFLMAAQGWASGVPLPRGARHVSVPLPGQAKGTAGETDPVPLAELFGLPGPHVTAYAAALVDAGSGRLLWGRRPHVPLHPASTTKMRALLALELGRLDEEVVVSPWAAGVEGSSLYLRAGDRFPLGELLEGLLLVSANDAAVAIAEHLAAPRRTSPSS